MNKTYLMASFKKVNIFYLLISGGLSFFLTSVYYTSAVLNNPYSTLSDFIYGITIFANYSKLLTIKVVYLYVILTVVIYFLIATIAAIIITKYYKSKNKR